MAKKKRTENASTRFPCGNLEEVLRMMRKCRENGSIDCDALLRQFMGQDHKTIDFRELRKQVFGEDATDMNLEEIFKKLKKR